MREGHHILLRVPTDYISHSSGKALRGLLGRFTTHHKLIRVTKKRRYSVVKLLRTKPGGMAAIVLMQAVHDLHTGVHPLGNQLRSFERFGLRA